MAQNKLNMRARAQFRHCRSVGRLSTAIVEEANVACPVPGPLQQVAGKELLDHTLALMTPEIRAIAIRRMHPRLPACGGPSRRSSKISLKLSEGP